MFLDSVRQPPRLRLSARAGLGAACFLLCLLGAIGWLLADARAAARRSAEQGLHNATLGLEADIRRTLDDLDASLRETIAGLGLHELPSLAPTVRRALLFDLAPAEGVTGIAVANAEGDIVHASRTDLVGPVSLIDRPYFHAHRANAGLGLLIDGPVRSQADGRWTLILSRRVAAPDGAFGGVVIGGLRLEHLQRLFASLQLGRRGSVALFNLDGRLLVHSLSHAADIGQDLGSAELLSHAPLHASGTFETAGMPDGRRLFAYRQIGGLPLLLEIGLDGETVYAGWWNQLWAAILLCLLVILAGLVGALALSLRRELARRAAAEGRALTSASHLAVLADNCQDLLLTLDRDGTGRFVSSASLAMLGHAPEALRGRGALELVHADDRPRLAEALAAMCSGLPQTTTYRVRHRDGGWRWLEANGRGLPEGGGAIVVARDVTERLRLEDHVRQRVRVEAIGRLTAGVAHDFNNLLTTLLGSLELLEDEVVDRPAALELATTARQMGERGARLTHQLLSFSRQQVLRPRSVDLVALLDRMGETLRRTLGPGITVRVQAEGAPAALVDASHLEAALLNLALNARDAMPTGGALLLEAIVAPSADQLPGLAPAAHVVIAVTDAGVGMDPGTLSQACEPFFSTKGVAGTGLGLSMAQGFARQSGGDLRIESRPGAGTRVELWLPRAAPAGPPAPTAAVNARLRGIGRVLLVDDMPDVLVTVGAFLESAGFKVVRAGSAEAALAVLAGTTPLQALVTDHAMPGLRGGDLVLEAQALRPGLPALVITGYAEAEELTRVASRVAILRKPFRREELVRRVLGLMGEGAATPARVPEPERAS